MSIDVKSCIRSYFRLAVESGLLLEHYVFLRLQAFGSTQCGQQDERVLKVIEESEDVWARLQQALRQLADIAGGFDATSELGRSVCRDLWCKQRILASLCRLWEEPRIMESIRVLLEAWSACIWIDPLQATIEELSASSQSPHETRSSGTYTRSAPLKEVEVAPAIQKVSSLPPLWQYLVGDHKSSRKPPKSG